MHAYRPTQTRGHSLKIHFQFSYNLRRADHTRKRNTGAAFATFKPCTHGTHAAALYAFCGKSL